MVDYGWILKKSLRFAITPKRWLQFFIVDVIFFLLTMALIMNDWVRNIAVIVLVLNNFNMLFDAAVFYMILPFLVLGIVWILLRLFLTGAMIHQSYKEKELDKSFSVAKKKFLSLFVAVIIIAIADLTGYIPIAGFLFNIFFALVFFVALQAIVVKDMGFWKGLKTSGGIFVRKPGSVIIMFLIVGILSIVIMGIFSLPLIYIYFMFIQPSLAVTNTNIVSVLLVYLVTNLSSVITTGLIFIIGSSITYAFTVKAQTEFYLRVRRKRFGIF